MFLIVQLILLLLSSTFIFFSLSVYWPWDILYHCDCKSCSKVSIKSTIIHRWIKISFKIYRGKWEIGEAGKVGKMEKDLFLHFPISPTSPFLCVAMFPKWLKTIYNPAQSNRIGVIAINSKLHPARGNIKHFF